MVDNQKEERIELLIRLQSIPKVAKAVNLKDISSLYKYFNRLEKKGIVEQKKGIWLRTDNDENLIELHNFEVTFKAQSVNKDILEWMLRRNELRFEENPRFKQNIIYFKEIPNFIIRTTPISIIFQQRAGFAIRLLRSPDAVDKLFSIMTNDILSRIDFLKKKLNIEIGETDRLTFNVNSNHVAFVKDLLAKRQVEKKEKFEVYVNNEKAWIVDISAGEDKPHLEGINPDQNPRNTKNYAKLIEDVSDGTFDHKNVVTKTEFGQVMKELKTEALQPLTTQLQLHLGVEQKQDVNMDLMNERLKKQIELDEKRLQVEEETLSLLKENRYSHIKPIKRKSNPLRGYTG